MIEEISLVLLLAMLILYTRKMMNRVSAQSARDRKKMYVENLEKKVALLEETVSVVAQ